MLQDSGPVGDSSTMAQVEDASKLEKLDWDILSRILVLVDISALFRLCGVSKTLKAHIVSDEFRDFWQSNHSTGCVMVLLEKQQFYIHHMWSPGDAASICKFSFSTSLLPEFQGVEVVASSHGLVCAKAFARCKVGVFTLVVGNPVTREWTMLPHLQVSGFGGSNPYVDFRMAVTDHASGAFRVAAFYNQLTCQVFDSATNTWSLKCHRSARGQLNIGVWYDLQEDSWTTELRTQVVPTGLEQNGHGPHTLGSGSFCIWKDEHERPFLGALWQFRSRQQNGITKGLGVWRIINNDNLSISLEKVNVVLLSKILPGDRFEGDGKSLDIRCNGESSLVCFVSKPNSPGRCPPIVYDLSKDSWFHLENRNPSLPYSQVVVYQPCLMRPQMVIQAGNQPVVRLERPPV